METTKHQIAIIGGGTAGIMVAAQLMRRRKGLSVTIFEPSEKHYCQAAFTLVGAGTYNIDDTQRSESTLIPQGVNWIKKYVSSVDPDNNSLKTDDGAEHTYEYLVVAPGLVMNLDGIEGLKETLGKNGVCSNYTDPNYTWEVVKNFKGGNALFTQAATPIKCGGAPQKAMYLSEEAFTKSGVREKTNVIYAVPGSVIFGVKEFAKTLNQILAKKDIAQRYFHKLVKIDGEKKIATFQITTTDDSNCTLVNDDSNRIHATMQGEATVEIPFDMLHLAPPQEAPKFIQESKLSYQEGPNKGWANVDHHSLRHNEFDNVFCLGDVAALPTAKTGAAVRKQAPVVVDNLIKLIDGKIADNKDYNGYSSCPLVTGYGKMVLAEFEYGNVRKSDPLLSTFVDTAQENWSMWILKKYGLPWLYWNQMMKGKM